MCINMQSTLSISNEMPKIMLTYRDCSRSFSHHGICNDNEVQNIELKGGQAAIVSTVNTSDKVNGSNNDIEVNL